MNKVLISVEGQTEETFVTEVLAPRFTDLDLSLIPVLVKTRRIPGQPAYRGGYLTYPKIKRELQRLLGDTSAAAITTMYDFYQLPETFPGYDSLPQGGGLKRVLYLEACLQEDIQDPRFRPYLQLHELEALLFVDIEKTTRWLFGDLQQLNQMRNIKQAFPNPEEIDEGAQTAPSKRIEKVFPVYQKELDASIIVLDVGLAAAREACCHFNEWISWLEQLASET